MKMGRGITGPCLSKSATSYFRRGCGRLALSPVAVVPVVMVPVLVDIMDVDTDTPVGAAANARAHVRSVTAGTDRCNRRRLRNEDEVALGIRRHRVRPGGLRNGFDQDAGAVDDAEHGCLVGRGRTGVSGYLAIPVGGRVVAPIPLVEPDLIRADDVADVRKILGLRVDHE